MATVLRAFKFALDPTPAQREKFSRCAGAARLAYNFALGRKQEAHRQREALIAHLRSQGMEQDEAKARVKIKIPGKQQVYELFQELRGGPGQGPGGIAPWHREVLSHCFQSAWIDADQAWKNWSDSVAGRRAGPPVGYPRFKKKNRSRDSFRLYHAVGAPTFRLESYRRLHLGSRLGTVRLHDSGKRMHRLIASGAAVVKSVTISCGGQRWYASVLCRVATDLPAPTRRQRQNGRVGVDVGGKHLAALSQPLQGRELIDNPRHLRRAARRLKKAQRALSRTRKGSARRRRAVARVGRLHHAVAQQRATALHTLSKGLATTFSCVAIEDLNVAGMTRSARGTAQKPGSKVRAKAGLNRSVLDAAPGELRRQLQYKMSRAGFFRGSEPTLRCPMTP
ncbi:RNA-guided endonuclease TnpB family protein, partial [Nocardiopsis composta]